MGGNKLEYGRNGPGETPGTPTASETSNPTMTRRQFFKLGATGTALVAGLAAGVPLSLMAPKTARAQETVIQGQSVRVVQLDKTLSELDAQTEQYRYEAMTEPDRNGIYYSNAVVIPGVVTFQVTLAENGKRLNINFPRERDETPSSPTAGARRFELDEFSNLVKRETGKDIKRVKTILERGTFDYNGAETEYATVYILPLDAQGNPITKQDRGQYLVYECSYFAGGTSGGISLIIEPNNQDTLACR